MERQNDFQNDEIEIDLKDLLFEILIYWKWIVLATIITAGITFAVSKFVIIPQYESTSELYVLSKSTSITSLADIQTGTSLTNDYIVVVKGRPVLDQVIENLGINETYTSLGNKITLDNPSNSRVLKITVRDKDPQRAKVIADEIANVASAYIAAKMNPSDSYPEWIFRWWSGKSKYRKKYSYRCAWRSFSCDCSYSHIIFV